MPKWITNWPAGGKWGTCHAALAAQIAAEGKYQVRLVADDFVATRYLLQIPVWAQTFAQRHPAVALARRLSPMDLYRAAQAEQAGQRSAA